MSDADIDDDFDDNFADDDDAKMVEEAETSVRTRLSSLEKRRLIDNLLEEKRLAKELKDDIDDLDDLDDDEDWD
ncbi:MAG: PA3496 family putative envelope integrity protein, partial [Psychrobacter sp.]